MTEFYLPIVPMSTSMSLVLNCIELICQNMHINHVSYWLKPINKILRHITKQVLRISSKVKQKKSLLSP